MKADKPTMDAWLRERGVDDETREIIVNTVGTLAGSHEALESAYDLVRAGEAEAREQVASLTRERDEALDALRDCSSALRGATLDERLQFEDDALAKADACLSRADGDNSK